MNPIDAGAADLVVPSPVPTLLEVAGGGRFPVHRIYGVGRNYAEHALEMGHDAREPPFFFMKPADAAWSVAPGSTGTLAYPTLTAELHHEVELVVAIGRAGEAIPAAEAARHIWGYAVGLDLTRRDLQARLKKQGRPWCMAKGFDRSAPVGQIVASDGLRTCGTLTLEVNGQVRQRGDLADMIWPVADVIAQLSQAWALQPGDLVFTGTPAGVGPVARGDRLRARLDGLPELKLQVV